jgi:hypothetical protein
LVRELISLKLALSQGISFDRPVSTACRKAAASVWAYKVGKKTEIRSQS